MGNGRFIRLKFDIQVKLKAMTVCMVDQKEIKFEIAFNFVTLIEKMFSCLNRPKRAYNLKNIAILENGG